MPPKRRLTTAIAITFACLGMSHSAVGQADGARAVQMDDYGEKPPALGSVVHSDPLAEAGTVVRSRCPSYRNSREFSDGGFVLRVSGTCSVDGNTTGVVARLEGLRLGDGEIRVETRLLSEPERVLIRIHFRTDARGLGGYVALLYPSRGTAEIRLMDERRAGPLLVRATDLAGLVTEDGWNSVAVRLWGRRMWLLANDQPILFAEDESRESGGALLGLTRLGDKASEEQVAVVWRNLTVSALAVSDPWREPTLEPRIPAPPEDADFQP